MLKLGVTFCRERKSEKLYIARRWNVLEEEPWLGGRAGTASGAGLRDYVQKDCQVGVSTPFPWETLG